MFEGSNFVQIFPIFFCYSTPCAKLLFAKKLQSALHFSLYFPFTLFQKKTGGIIIVLIKVYRLTSSKVFQG